MPVFKTGCAAGRVPSKCAVPAGTARRSCGGTRTRDYRIMSSGLLPTELHSNDFTAVLAGPWYMKSYVREQIPTPLEMVYEAENFQVTPRSYCA